MMKFKVAYFPFPDEIHGKIGGLVRYLKGSREAAVLIDSRATEEEQAFYLKHELSHIHLGHLTGSRDAGMTESGREGEDMRETEREADAYAEIMTDSEFSFLMSFCKEQRAFTG